MTNITNEQLHRKSQSEEYLKKMNVPINQYLPYVESEDEVRLRSIDEVVKRIYIIWALVTIGHGYDRKKIISELKSNDLYNDLTPNEKAFIKSKKPTQEQEVEATWRIEAAYLLLWSIEKIDELPFPSEICDTDLMHEIIKSPDNYTGLINSSALRSEKEILDMHDLTYRTHWAVRDAFLKNQEPPANIIPGVIYERHYAINWLTFYAEEWDDVTTDT